MMQYGFLSQHKVRYHPATEWFEEWFTWEWPGEDPTESATSLAHTVAFSFSRPPPAITARELSLKMTFPHVFTPLRSKQKRTWGLRKKKKKKKKSECATRSWNFSPPQRKRRANTFLCVNAANKRLFRRAPTLSANTNSWTVFYLVSPLHVFSPLLTVVARSNAKRASDYHGNA